MTADPRRYANIAGDADACGSLAVAQVEIIHDFYGNERQLRRSNQMLMATTERGCGVSDRGLNGSLRGSALWRVTRRNVSDVAAAEPLESHAAQSEHLSQARRASLSAVGRQTNTSTSREAPARAKKRRRRESLTSPGSDSRCCCSEPLTLTNLLLGPTRSAKLPMVTLWLQSLQSVGQLRGSPGSLCLFFPHRFTYTTPLFLPPAPPVRR